MKLKISILHNKRFVGVILSTIFLLLGATSAFGQEASLIEASDSTLVISVDSLIIEGGLRDSVIIDSAPIIIEADTIVYEQVLPEETVEEAYLVADSVFTSKSTIINITPKKEFKPNSTRAVLYSAIFPGLGQIYNRKYWKLPLVYGGYMGFLYAITWNNSMYQDYYNAYMDIMDDAINRPDADASQWHQSWKDFIPRGDYENYITNTTFQGQLQRRKDYYRRYRDLSIILAIGFYAICMIDAYVDAELFDFDISPDLSMRIEPLILPRTSFNQWSFGLNYCITF